MPSKLVYQPKDKYAALASVRKSVDLRYPHSRRATPEKNKDSLHDAVEDCGGAKRLRDIERKFDKKVARIVQGCTDTDQTPKPPWLERKKAYVAHVRHAPMPTKLVSASDKLHNVRAILMDYRKEGEKLWSRFNRGKQGALWYYRALVNALSGKRLQPLVQELDRTLTELELVSNNGAQVKQPPAPNEAAP